MVSVDGAQVFLAIDVGGTTYAVAIVSDDGCIIKKMGGSTDRSGGSDWMIHRLITLSVGLTRKLSVRACGIGFGGPVDFAAQTVVSSTHVDGWQDVPLAKLISQAIDVPVIIENDANVGAYGEYSFGAGRNVSHLVYYTVSTGIGGGVIVDGKIFRGANGNAGELGHVVVAPDGPTCDCGNRGCLEALCSAKSIGEKATELVRNRPRGGRVIRQHAAGVVDARAVFNAARDGDPLAMEIVEEVCLYLGMGIGGTMNALAPELIVVGGGMAKAGRVLFDPLRRQAVRFTMPIHRKHLRIVPARLRDNTVLLGAATMARDFAGILPSE